MDPESPKDMGLLDIPQVVLQDHLFPFLKLNDLLRLRRVSKASKILAEEPLRLHHVNNPREIEIRESGGERSLSAFLQIGIPFARIYLNNIGVEFFDNPCIPEFLELCGSKITHLRVHHFFAFSNKTEMPFYQSLQNLEHLELEQVDATNWRCDFEVCTMPDGREVPRPPCPIPLNFKKLKTLKFGHIDTARKHDHGYWVDVVECCCQHLEYIGHPRYDHPLPPNNEPFGLPNPFPMPMLSNNGAFRCVSRVIDWRHQKHPAQPNLKYYDLKNFKDTSEGGGSSYDLMFFLQDCYERGVKLLNVDAELYYAMGPSQDEQYLKKILHPVESVKNINRAFFIGEMPNLKKIVVTGTSRCTFGPFWEEGRKPQWPALETVDLTVDSMELEELIGLDLGPQDTEQLLEFLFEDVVRYQLTELTLSFDEKSSRKEDLPCPRTGNIVTSCPNLKKLSLVNWVGTNKSLSKMWGGLQHLEQLVLQDCRTLGNVAFVGENKEQPTFLKLKKLKMLSLSGLELMPKVSDTVFKLVLRNMKLEKLHLSSRNPLKTITPSGIKELLTGQFASCIQKFPFTGWTLAGVSEKDFKQLESQFRSYYMI